ncbi:Kelch repeat-containing protein [Horticoccus sp. 23ND18S-11]|uniref:Kelch repeat-containing protein n=1 Tax=Horticoccus sp. 23ND18S-11 TaxID=3391832 RepID=UPI0039C9E83F
MIHVAFSHFCRAGWLALLLSMINVHAATAATWERLAPLPVGNGGFVSAVLGGDVHLAGGTTWQGDTKLWLDQVWAYDARKNAWRDAGRLPAPLAYGVTGHDGRTWWIAGGSTGEKTHQSLWKIETGKAAQLVAPLTSGVVYAAHARIGARLYAVGGTDDQAAIDRVGSAFVAIDLATGAITRLASYPEAGLTTGTAAALGDRMFVFGGARWDATDKKVVNHRSAHVYSVATNRWEKLPALPHPGRGYCAVTLDDRHILVAGGYRNDEVEFVADAYLFDVTSRTYLPTRPLPYAGMVGLVQAGEWLYCLGGEDKKRHRTDAVFRIRWRELLASAR